MGTYFRLTQQLAYIPASTQADQALYAAVDVTRFDILDLVASAAFDAPTQTPSLTIDLLSGCQCASADGWIKIASFPALGASTVQKLPLTGGFYRYLRWSISGNGLQNATAARFLIEGVGRSYGGT